MISEATGTPRKSGWSPDRSILRTCNVDANALSTMCRVDICPGFAVRPVRLPPASGRSAPVPADVRDRCVRTARLDPANDLTRGALERSRMPPRNTPCPNASTPRPVTASSMRSTEWRFLKEDEFQALTAEHPELLDGQQIRPGDARRWILVIREKGTAPSAGRASCGVSASPSCRPVCHGARRQRREDRRTLPAPAQCAAGPGARRDRRDRHQAVVRRSISDRHDEFPQRGRRVRHRCPPDASIPASDAWFGSW